MQIQRQRPRMEETGNIFNIFEGYSEEKERESKNQGRFNSETDENFFCCCLSTFDLIYFTGISFNLLGDNGTQLKIKYHSMHEWKMTNSGWINSKINIH